MQKVGSLALTLPHLIPLLFRFSSHLREGVSKRIELILEHESFQGNRSLNPDFSV